MTIDKSIRAYTNTAIISPVYSVAYNTFGIVDLCFVRKLALSSISPRSIQKRPVVIVRPSTSFRLQHARLIQTYTQRLNFRLYGNQLTPAQIVDCVELESSATPLAWMRMQCNSGVAGRR